MNFNLTQVFPEARLLETSEWSSHVSLVVSVDKDCASLQVVTHIESLRGEGERGEDEGRR